MSSFTRPDFAQKLLSDLRLRKERMAAAASNSHTSAFISQDAYGSGRRTPITTTDMNSLAKVSSKQRVSNGGSQSARMSMEASNQIVPFGGAQNSRQSLDLSMTLSYALDDAGKLKKMNLTGSNAMIGLLHQISKRSMGFTYEDRKAASHMQWPSNSQFPTLTNLHINEISKGAQKINQILRTFSKGVNGNRASVDIGKELLKGALDLEESLRMLVSLQEASDYMVVPRKKSRVKLLELNEDDQNSTDKSDEKRIERPVFSFDRRSKNAKSNEAMDSNTHRRSASCGAELSSFPVGSKSKPKRISNVVAKLMGLDQVQENAGRSMSNGDQSRSNQGMEMRVGFSRGDEFRDVGGWSVGYQSGEKLETGKDKIVILTSKRETETVNGHGYKAKAQEKKSMWSEREREEMITHIKEMSKRSGSRESLRKKESGVSKKNGSNDEIKRVRVVAEKSNENSHQRRNVKKLPVKPQQHQVPPQRSEYLRKKTTLEPRNGKKAQSKSPAKKMEESGPVVDYENSLKDIYEVKDEAKDVVDKEVVTVRESSNDRGRKMQEDVKTDVTSKSTSLKMEDKHVCGTTVQRAKNNSKMAKDEVMAKAMKAGSGPSREMKRQTTILQRLRQRQPVKKGAQRTDGVKSEAAEKPSSVAIDEGLEKVPQVLSVSSCYVQKEDLPKLTEEEVCLKQTLITSQALLSTAEAIFKLNIPIGILCPSEALSEEKGSKLITDCALELLKVKGRRREHVLSPRVRCLDELVRHLNADMETLREYGRMWKGECDPGECLLKMIERDVCHVGADVNCMWDAGWKRVEAERDEVVRDVEKRLLNEVLDEVLGGFLEMSCWSKV